MSKSVGNSTEQIYVDRLYEEGRCRYKRGEEEPVLSKEKNMADALIWLGYVDAKLEELGS